MKNLETSTQPELTLIELYDSLTKGQLKTLKNSEYKRGEITKIVIRPITIVAIINYQELYDNVWEYWTVILGSRGAVLNLIKYSDKTYSLKVWSKRK